jgi:hypothetical protein
LDSNGNEHTIENKKQITRTIYCATNTINCNDFYVFSVDHIQFTKYVRFQSPLLRTRALCGCRYRLHMQFKQLPPPFNENSDSKTVNIRVTDHLINSTWTAYEIGWKYTFLVLTILVRIKFSYCDLWSERCTQVMFWPFQRSGYMLKLLDLPTDVWTVQQKWVSTADVSCSLLFMHLLRSLRSYACFCFSMILSSLCKYTLQQLLVSQPCIFCSLQHLCVRCCISGCASSMICGVMHDERAY